MPKATTAEEAALRAGPRKRATVGSLADEFGRATSAIVTDYRGPTVKQLEELRTQLRGQGIDYHVVKNTLARKAAREAGIGDLASVLSGPVGLALGFGELSVPAKVLSDYHRVNRRLPLIAGFVEGQVLDAHGVQTLAELPPRDVLLARLAGTIQSPLTHLAGALASITGNLAATLDAYRAKLEAA
jgi:large subunit ribosomal protein L10